MMNKPSLAFGALRVRRLAGRLLQSLRICYMSITGSRVLSRRQHRCTIRYFFQLDPPDQKGVLELMLLNDIGNRAMYGYKIERMLYRSHGLLMGTSEDTPAESGNE